MTGIWLKYINYNINFVIAGEARQSRSYTFRGAKQTIYGRGGCFGNDKVLFLVYPLHKKLFVKINQV